MYEPRVQCDHGAHSRGSGSQGTFCSMSAFRQNCGEEPSERYMPAPSPTLKWLAIAVCWVGDWASFSRGAPYSPTWRVVRSGCLDCRLNPTPGSSRWVSHHSCARGCSSSSLLRRKEPLHETDQASRHALVGHMAHLYGADTAAESQLFGARYSHGHPRNRCG